MDSAAAMSRAEGRCDTEPAAYLTARPIAWPVSSVIRIVRTLTRVVLDAASCTITYTPMDRVSAFRQPGRPVSPIMVTNATRPTRYGSSASTWLVPGCAMMIG